MSCLVSPDVFPPVITSYSLFDYLGYNAKSNQTPISHFPRITAKLLWNHVRFIERGMVKHVKLYIIPAILGGILILPVWSYDNVYFYRIYHPTPWNVLDGGVRSNAWRIDALPDFLLSLFGPPVRYYNKTMG